jgi:release factor glutamine methyltransferase
VKAVEGAPGKTPLPGPGEAWDPIRLTRWSGEYLEGKGVENGRLDAELLLAHTLGLGRLDLYLQFDRPLRPAELESFKVLLRRRASREPLQYVLGQTTFRELDLRTDSRALIPRQETEVLVQEILDWADLEGNSLSAVDVGTGSGAIALSLLKEGPFQRVVAIDPSSKALELAEENARNHGLEDRIDFRLGSGLEPLHATERFDVIASNPPYIPEGERASLQPEVRDWEPEEALFAGPDGLDVLLPLLSRAPAFLEAGGLIALEVGEAQADQVARAMQETGGYRAVRVRPDLAGRDRVVLGVASSRNSKDL